MYFAAVTGSGPKGKGTGNQIGSATVLSKPSGVDGPCSIDGIVYK